MDRREMAEGKEGVSFAIFQSEMFLEVIIR